jgi:uncharacterized membrane protein
MPELLAIAYEDETVADRAADELRRCAGELLVDPDASSVLICERDGTCRLTISRQAGAQAHWSEFWGTLLEGLLSDDDRGAIDALFRSRLLLLLRPGTSILLMAVPDDGEGQALEALSHFEGQALSQRLA